MNTSAQKFPYHQEIIECDGRYAIIWYQGAYFIGSIMNGREYTRIQKYETFEEVAIVYNQLLIEK